MPDKSSINQPTQPINRAYTACPYLGLKEDPSTWLFYPNPANHCYKSNPPRPIDPDHQRQFCLSKTYPLCKIYQQSFSAPLPPVAELEPKKRKLPLWVYAGAVFGILLLLFITVSFFWNQDNSSLFLSDNQNIIATDSPTAFVRPTITPTSTLAHPLSDLILTPYITYTPLVPPTIRNTPTATSTTAVPTLVATPGPALKTPFGPYGTYLLHKVSEGESLGSLATLYRTSIPVIQATNQLVQGAALWPDTILIMMPGVTDPNLTVKLMPILIEIPIYPVELAARYNVSAQSIIAYNLVDPQSLIPAGRWLIIPISSP